VDADPGAVLAKRSRELRALVEDATRISAANRASLIKSGIDTLSPEDDGAWLPPPPPGAAPYVVPATEAKITTHAAISLLQHLVQSTVTSTARIAGGAGGRSVQALMQPCFCVRAAGSVVGAASFAADVWLPCTLRRREGEAPPGEAAPAAAAAHGGLSAGWSEIGRTESRRGGRREAFHAGILRASGAVSATKTDAKKAAALQAARLLHAIGGLDDHFRPTVASFGW